MDKEQLIAVARKSASNFVGLVRENADALLDAAQASEQTSEKPSLKIAHALNIDMGNNEMNDSITWSIRHKADVDCMMPDPNQPELWEDDNESGL